VKKRYVDSEKFRYALLGAELPRLFIKQFIAKCVFLSVICYLGYSLNHSSDAKIFYIKLMLSHDRYIRELQYSRVKF
jgi:hypothetical protein